MQHPIEWQRDHMHKVTALRDIVFAIERKAQSSEVLTRRVIAIVFP